MAEEMYTAKSTCFHPVPAVVFTPCLVREWNRPTMIRKKEKVNSLKFVSILLPWRDERDGNECNILQAQTTNQDSLTHYYLISLPSTTCCDRAPACLHQQGKNITKDEDKCEFLDGYEEDLVLYCWLCAFLGVPRRQFNGRG
jgi:hypothetical protein